MVATVLHRSIGQGEGGEITGDFPDKADVSDWAVPSMAWAVDSGIVHGNNGMLEPQRAITRAEMATMLLNAHDAGLAPLRAQRPQRRRVQCKRRGHDAPCVALSPHLQSPPSHRLPASRRPQPPQLSPLPQLPRPQPPAAPAAAKSAEMAHSSFCCSKKVFHLTNRLSWHVRAASLSWICPNPIAEL